MSDANSKPDDPLKKLLTELHKVGQASINPKHYVVLVETADIVGIIKYQLEGLGLTKVVSFQTACEAIRFQIQMSEPVSLIICAEKLPDLSGTDYLQEVIGHDKIRSGPFLLTMNQPTRERLMIALEEGVDEVIGKPFSAKQLYPKVQETFANFHRFNNLEKVYNLIQECLEKKDYDFVGHTLDLLEQEFGVVERTQFYRARQLIGQGEFATAVQMLNDIVRNNPRYVHAYNALGEAHLYLSQYTEALSVYQRAIEVSPLNPMRYEQAATLLRQMDRHHEAIQLLKQALVHKLNNPILLHMASQSCLTTGKFEDAMRYIRMALRYDEDNTNYLNQLGVCLRETGDYKGSLEVYNKAIKLDPENRFAHFNKAMLHRFVGDTKKATDALSRVCERFPDFEVAQRELKKMKAS